MLPNYMNIDSILDIDKWQDLQDSLAVATGLAIITVNFKGAPITSHSCRVEFCDYVRNDPVLESYCHKCDSIGGLEATRIGAPYIYLCHCNVVDIAVPIIIGGQYIGATMAGEVLLNPIESKRLDQIVQSPAKQLFDNPDICDLYNQLPIMSFDEIRNIANMLFRLCNYIVEESCLKNMLLENYNTIFNKNDQRRRNGHNMNMITEGLKDTLMQEVSLEGGLTCLNPVLRPAFDFIKNNGIGKVSQKDLADLCFISTSHFSRLFIKETGKTFPDFLSTIKIKNAKHLLKSTDLTVSQISEVLGYNDPSYFNTQFKKRENFTPGQFRKFYKKTKEKPRIS